MNRGIRLATAAYRLLIRLYPASFRDVFADEMIWVFNRALQDAIALGIRALVGVAVREIAEMPASIATQHIHERRLQAMTILSLGTRKDVRLVRWAARSFSLLPIAFFLLLITLNEDIRTDLQPTIIFQGILTLILILAWRWELTGGTLLAVGAPLLSIMFILNGIRNNFSLLPAVLVGGAIGLPYLIVGWFFHSVGRQNSLARSAEMVEEKSGRSVLLYLDLAFTAVVTAVLFIFSFVTPVTERTVVEDVAIGPCTEPENIVRSFEPFALSSQALPDSLKGYELYSYQKDGYWQFTFMVGLNRIRTADDMPAAIEGTSYTVRGIVDLKATLALIPDGETVFWCGFERPDPAQVREIEALALRRGLEFVTVP